jgi:hypothetical protein
MVARTLHCTVIEVPAMNEPRGSRKAGFEDLVPWADPYIAALIEKLRREYESDDDTPRCENRLVGELPPPLNDRRETPWQADWSPRNWPRG